MKPIKISELKEGDWFCNRGIFRVNERNNLSEYKTYAFVDGIVGEKIRIKCWGVQDEKISDRNFIDKAEELFLLDEEEIGKISKLILVNAL